MTDTELSFRANKPIYVTTLYHSILANCDRAWKRGEFQTSEDSSEIGIKLRLAQTLKRVLCPLIPITQALRSGSGRPCRPCRGTHSLRPQSSDFLNSGNTEWKSQPGPAASAKPS